MNKNDYIQNGGILATVGAFIATIPTLIQISGPSIIAKTITHSGLLLGAIGVILLTIPFMPYLTTNYPIVKRVKRTDLKRTYDFCCSLFGANFSSFNSTKKWFNHNNKMFWIVEKTKSKGPITISEISSYYAIIPLTSYGVQMLRDGQVDGRGFTTDHISPKFEDASALYIGAIGSKGLRTKGFTLGSLITSVEQLIEEKSCPIYTRPTTKDGLRIAKQRGFEAIDGSGAHDLNKIYVHDGIDFS